MRAVSFLMFGLATGAGFWATGCGNGDDSQPPVAVVRDGGVDASKGLDATTAGEGGGGPSDAQTADAPQDVSPIPPTLALMRMGNWSVDAPPIDFCMAAHGTGAFQGPILAARAAVINDEGVLDAGTGALAFPQTTAYLLVDPGQYDVRVVAGGATGCQVAIVPQDATDLPPLPSGGRVTIALFGATHPQNGEAALKLVGLTDELTNSVSNALLIRVVNAAVDIPNVDVGLFMNFLTPFFTMPVPYGGSSAGLTMADHNGYGIASPIVSESIAARTVSAIPLFDASANTIVAQSGPISLPNGISTTFVVVGGGGTITSEGGVALGQILECIDNAGTVGLQGTCQVISQ